MARRQQIARLLQLYALASSLLQVQSQPYTFDLGGVWSLRNANNSVVLNATVPGMVHTDLLAASLISEPYFQYNDRDLAWIVGDDWTYSREFTPPDELLGSPNAALVFEGIATIATVLLNGASLLSANNQFVTWRLPIGNLLRPGTNNLTVAIRSSTAFAAAADHAYNMSTHNITSCPAPEEHGFCYRNFVRQVCVPPRSKPTLFLAHVHAPLSYAEPKLVFVGLGSSVRP